MSMRVLKGLKQVHPTTQQMKGSTLREMTTSRRVQDRSKKKRVHDLEIVTEKWKIFSKITHLMEVIHSEPEHVISIRNLERERRQINLPKPHKLSDFLRKSPKLFDLYKDRKGTLWVGMTHEAEELVVEQESLIQRHSERAAELVTKLLMMSIDKRIRVDKIAHFRRDFGLPPDFRRKWVYEYPDLFRLVKAESNDGGCDLEYLELVSWMNEWATTELEKRHGLEPSVKLCLEFPMKFPPDFKKLFRFGGTLEHFQKREYLSPYADARGLLAGSQEFDKRAVAVMHELLSFTLEKRLVTDHLTHFRTELVMPQKLMRLLLKHFGIFYVSERGKRFHVFLNEAYDGQELIHKCPLVLWKEKVLGLIGSRGKRKKAVTFDEFSDVEDLDLFRSDSDDERLQFNLEQESTMDGLDGDVLQNDAEMDIEEVSSAYKDA